MEELFDFPIMKSGVDELVADIIKSNYDNRRLIINDEINNNLLESICLYILKYNQEDKDVPEDKRKPIWIILNSVGGVVNFGMGLIDCIKHSITPVYCLIIGMAASMGAVLLASGEKGKRYATPNAEILIHQPLIAGGGLSGQTTEIKIHADHMVKTREKLNKLLSDRTGQSLETIQRDTERDNYMTAEEALKYGLIDGIMDKRK